MDNRVLMSLLLLAATVINLSRAADPYNAADYDHTGMSSLLLSVTTANEESSFFPLLCLEKKLQSVFIGCGGLTYLSNNIRNKVTLKFTPYFPVWKAENRNELNST